MRNNLLSVLILLALPLAVQAAGRKASPVVERLDRQLDDAGCTLSFRDAGINEYPVFIHGPFGAWMKLDGREVELKQNEGRVRRGLVEYESGDYKIRINYGYGKQQEGGAEYRRAIIRVTRHGETTKVKAKGGCGC